MKQFFTDYPRFYGIFKKLPLICLIFYPICGFLFGIIDITSYITDLEAFALILWPLVGFVVGLIAAYVTALTIAPIVTIADTLLEQNKTQK